MNKLLKNGLLGTSIMLLFFFTVSQAGMAGEEVPPLPMTVQGVALIDGTPAPKGTVVAAFLNGEQVEEFLINTSSGDYCFWISGTGENEGKPVTFTVDGKDPEESLTWKSGDQVLSFELSVGKVADAGSKKGSTSNANSGSLTGTEESEASGENSKAEVIENSVSEPDVATLKNMNSDSGDKEAAESSEDSPEPRSAPGFHIIYAVAGILFLAFVFNLGRESRRKP